MNLRTDRVLPIISSSQYICYYLGLDVISLIVIHSLDEGLDEVSN